MTVDAIIAAPRIQPNSAFDVTAITFPKLASRLCSFAEDSNRNPLHAFVLSDSDAQPSPQFSSLRNFSLRVGGEKSKEGAIDHDTAATR